MISFVTLVLSSTFANAAVTGGVSLDAGQDSSNNIFMTKVGADPFTIQVQTKTRRTRGSWR